jgi:soluble lytic murein transglycosylase-like protein
MFPAVLLGCLAVIFITNLVSQPEKVKAASLSAAPASDNLGAGLLANFNLETIAEVPTQSVTIAKTKQKAKKKSASYPAAVTQWCSLIEQYAQEQNLDPNLVAAVILEESGGNPQAYSSSGAVGLMQIMPRDGLAANFICGSNPCFSSRPSMNELFDPESNIAYGTRMLGSLYNKYGNIRDALLAYGPTGMGYSYADIVLGIYDRYK